MRDYRPPVNPLEFLVHITFEWSVTGTYLRNNWRWSRWLCKLEFFLNDEVSVLA